MWRETWPQWVLGALVVAGVVAGIWAVGGPETGRMERRDAQRMSELRQLRSLADCQIKENDGKMPETLAETDTCSYGLEDDALLAREGYTFTVLDEDSYRLCATMELPEPPYARFDFDPESGCMTVNTAR